MKRCLQCGTVATNNEAKCESCGFAHFTEPTKGLEEIMADQAARIAALEAALEKAVQIIQALPKDDIGGGIAALVKYCKSLLKGE